MRGYDNQAARLSERWEKANALWKKASKRCQEAVAAYHWTTDDDRAEWNRMLATRMREAIAFKKAAAAHEALSEFLRTRPRGDASD